MATFKQRLQMHARRPSRPRRLSPLETFLGRLPQEVDWDREEYAADFDANLPSRWIRENLTAADLMSLRAASKACYQWTQRNPACLSKMFQTLFVFPRYSSSRSQSLQAFKAIGQHCQQLVIRLQQKPPSSTAPGQVFDDDFPTPFQGHAASPMRRSRAQTLSDTSRPSALLSQQNSEAAALNGVFEAPPSMPTTMPTSRFAAQSSDWSTVFRILKGINTISISSPGDSGWPGFKQIEATLVSIRMAIEQSLLLSFHTLRLEPIHAFGILHCRWAGGTAFGEASWMAGAIWTRVNTIEAQLLNPFPYITTSQRMIFMKVLHSWLRSFRERLRVLKFHWVGMKGPNPLLLDKAYRKKDFSAPPIEWDMLEELWLGNLEVDSTFKRAEDPKHADLIQDRAPLLKSLWVSKDGEDSEAEDTLINFDNKDEWRNSSYLLRG
ncbi:hypothetical protein H2199_000785 [Coniosporium tulheliwenetii]|uniref:Uncharacterized protein n=1 Tax=Coniosporium tulheliwenetii TaxID=3383036 RepID=A0ACC2ZMZ9_9PEZI|nr:hypothetical protein H2199_000785 [Cladosporium sp. JES 115]